MPQQAIASYRDRQNDTNSLSKATRDYIERGWALVLSHLEAKSRIARYYQRTAQGNAPGSRLDSGEQQWLRSKPGMI